MKKLVTAPKKVWANETKSHYAKLYPDNPTLPLAK